VLGQTVGWFQSKPNLIVNRELLPVGAAQFADLFHQAACDFILGTNPNFASWWPKNLPD